MKSLIPTGQDYIGSGAWYQNCITKPSEIRFRAFLTEGRRDVRLETVYNRIVVNLADMVRRTTPCLNSLFTRRISFVNRSGYKTPSCELQDPRRENGAR